MPQTSNNMHPDFHTLLLRPDVEVRGQFIEHFEDEIATTAKHYSRAFRELLAFDKLMPESDRTGIVLQFLVHAMNASIISTQLFIDGLLVPSGNMMRHYGEASAVAHLLSHPGLPDFDNYRKAPAKYSVDNAIERVNKRKTRKLLNISEDGWKRFMANTKSYNPLSHSSALAAEYAIHLSEPNSFSFGSAFDPGKLDIYRFEMERRLTSAKILIATIGGCAQNIDPELTKA